MVDGQVTARVRRMIIAVARTDPAVLSDVALDQPSRESSPAPVRMNFVASAE